MLSRAEKAITFDRVIKNEKRTNNKKQKKKVLSMVKLTSADAVDSSFLLSEKKKYTKSKYFVIVKLSKCYNMTASSNGGAIFKENVSIHIKKVQYIKTATVIIILRNKI